MSLTPRYIQFRRGPNSGAAVDPVLLEAEPGYDTEAKALKIGDGVTPWSQLPVLGAEIAAGQIAAAIAAAQSTEADRLQTGIDRAQASQSADRADAARVAAETAKDAAETAAGRVDLGALDDAVQATAQDRVLAQAAAVSAGTGANRAEAARDAAFANADVFPDIATGRAAVADGGQFMVLVGDEIIRYRRDSSTTQTEMARYPAASNVAAVAARETGYIAPPSASSALYRIERVEVFQSVNGAAITLPTLFCVREMGRDAVSNGRFRMRFASFDGTSTFVQVLREGGAGHNGTFLPVPAGSFEGRRWIDLVTLNTDLGVPSGRVVGRALVNFGGGEVFGTYAGTILYSVGGLYPVLVQNGPQFSNDAAEVANSALALTDDHKLPFDDSVTATAIRRLVRDVRLYNADPTHQYVISVLAVETFSTPLTRFRMTIRDITAGVDVCTVARTVSSQPGFAAFKATLQSPVKLTSSGLSPAVNTGVYAVVHLDWSAVSNFFSFGSNTYTLAGISPERVYADDDIADYLDSDHVHEVITVGASGADYTTLRAAVESTYSWITGATPVSSAPICDRACYHHRVLIRLIDDATYNATFLQIPEWVEIQGNGYGRTFIGRESTDPDAMLEMHLCGKLRDLTIISATHPEYCIHSDDFNRNATGGAAQNRFIRQSFKRIRMQGAAGHSGFLFGGGLSAGQHILMDDVIGEHADATVTAAAFFWHNTGPTISTPSLNVGVRPSLIEMRGCGSPDHNGIYLQTLHTAGICVLSLTDCEFNRVIHEIPAGEVTASGRARIGWEITGQHRGAWVNIDGDADSFTLEWAPVASLRRRARNSTGFAIPKGRFVRFTGTGTVALCAANERPDAWTIAAIANGADGDVILTRRIDRAYIEAAAAGSGEWGIATAGTLDYSAAIKLGRTVGGIVLVY